MLCKVLYIADLFCLHGNIRPGNITISLFFGALKLFLTFLYFQLRSVGYIASYKLNYKIDNIENVSSQGVSSMLVGC